jgi:hypothetical protein
MNHGKRNRRDQQRQRLIAVARKPAQPSLPMASMLLGLIIVILVLGKSGVMV